MINAEIVNRVERPIRTAPSRWTTEFPRIHFSYPLRSQFSTNTCECSWEVNIWSSVSPEIPPVYSTVTYRYVAEKIENVSSPLPTCVNTFTKETAVTQESESMPIAIAEMRILASSRFNLIN
ncbi:MULTISPECIES: hypothetical protein [Haloferax]|uniref:hypothetical protein n=1 Tax=Haloferax TaxID=2251 RepID=UPI0011C06191|nr:MULTISPECIES: hypothetical protein [Haloferax]